MFFGRPSGIAWYLWRHLFTSPTLVYELGWTAAGTLSAFGLGSAAAVLVGLLFVAAPRLERSLEPYVLVTLPGAVPVIFAGLRLGLIYAMLGVIGAEIIVAEHGVGQTLAYLGATFDMSGVMAVLVVLALLATAVTRGLTGLERRLIRWQ
jgi:ABC-type nitrate/sulfonate/bicarbonate transport system permease component